MFSSLKAKGGNHPSASTKNTSKVIVKSVETKKPTHKTPTKHVAGVTKQGKQPHELKKARSSTSESPVGHSRSKKIRKRVIDSSIASFPDSEDDGTDGFDRLTSSSATPAVEVGISREKRSVLLDNPHVVKGLVNARDLLQTSKGYVQVFGQETVFELQLPYGQEQYEAVRPKNNSEDFDPLSEIDDIMVFVSAHFSPSLEVSQRIRDPEMKDCIIRRIRRAIRDCDRTMFLRGIQEYNDLILELRNDGKFAEAIGKLDSISLKIVSELLNQVYRRIVSPRSQELRNYEAFSSNVYGELLPSFVDDIFDVTGLKSDHVFVDLGSGVGNCVLQAALQIGCESWGCEVMETASELAQLQQTEFENRVKAYGLVCGNIHLKGSDFTEDEQIKSALQNADCVLVNNYAFSAQLNDSLVNMFLDLKDGCRIVSLRSFVPQGHVISEHNIESPINILSVEKRQFKEDSVSWTTAGGVYYVSTIDRSRLKRFRA